MRTVTLIDRWWFIRLRCMLSVRSLRTASRLMAIHGGRMAKRQTRCLRQWTITWHNGGVVRSVERHDQTIDHPHSGCSGYSLSSGNLWFGCVSSGLRLCCVAKCRRSTCKVIYGMMCCSSYSPSFSDGHFALGDVCVWSFCDPLNLFSTHTDIHTGVHSSPHACSTERLCICVL